MYQMDEIEIEAISRVIRKGQLFRYRGEESGELDAFESKLKNQFGKEHALIVSSGTSALICALIGLGVGPGDEVIVPAYTFMATALAVLRVGAIPVIAEIDSSLMIDPDDVARRITSRTRAIVPVHMHGLPADLGRLGTLAGQHKIPILEDACQAFGGSWRGHRLGTLGTVGVFSFNHFKVLSCGEGGAVITDDRRIYERALIQHDGGCHFRSHASGLSEPIFAGDNYRASEIQGALLNAQYTRLETILSELRKRNGWMTIAVLEAGGETIPVHDGEGQCGCVLGIRYPDQTTRIGAQARLKAEMPECEAWAPIERGRHIYRNWLPVITQNSGADPRTNAYLLPGNAGHHGCMGPDDRPQTLEICARTLLLPMELEKGREWHENAGRFAARP